MALRDCTRIQSRTLKLGIADEAYKLWNLKCHELGVQIKVSASIEYCSSRNSYFARRQTKCGSFGLQSQLRSNRSRRNRKRWHFNKKARVVSSSCLKQAVRETSAAQIVGNTKSKCTQESENKSYPHKLRQLLELPGKQQEIVALSSGCACTVKNVAVRRCSSRHCDFCICRPSILQLLGC